MSHATNCPTLLKLFAQTLNKVPDPRSKRGSYPLTTLLALTFLGLLANCTNPTELARWSKNHLETLRPFLRFRWLKKQWCAPVNLTFTRLFETLSLADLQNAFAEFVNILLADTTLVAAVDGKAAKQMKDANGNPLLMLNVFAQQVKLHLASWNVRGDKTNEPACLKKHLGELFTMFPCLKLLTGDAIFAQRPLLEAIQEYERDYLFQVKENQPKVLRKLEEVFKGAELQEPDDTLEIVDDALPEKPQRGKSQDRKVSKKKGAVEVHRLWVKKWAAEYVREQLGIPGCRSVIRLDKEVRHPEKGTSFETRYYISSLDPDKVSASEFQNFILRHWEVENCLHLQKDRYFDEDKHVIVRGWGAMWTVLTNIALSLGQLLWAGERTLKEVRERCYINPVPNAKKLGWNRETC